MPVRFPIRIAAATFPAACLDVSREQRARLIGLSKCITYIDDESRIGESGDAVVAPIASGDSGPAGSPAL